MSVVQTLRLCSCASASPQGLRLGIIAALAAAGLSTPAAQAVVSQHAASLPDFTPVAADLGNLAENENFWQNFIQYGRFFTSVLLGTAYIGLRPIANLLQNPRTAVFVVLGFAALIYFIRATLTAMLGTADPIYIQ